MGIVIPYKFKGNQVIGSQNFGAQLDADFQALSNGSRTILPDSRWPGNIFYVATNGADNPISGGAGTVATPFLTPSYAAAQMAAALDFGGQTVTLQAVAGHANFTTGFVIPTWVGGGAFVFDIGSGSIIVTNGSAVAITGPLPGICTIQNGTIAGTGTSQSAGIQHFGGGQIRVANITFGACTFAYVSASGLGGGQPSVNITGPIVCSAVVSGQALFFAAGAAIMTFGFVNGAQLIKATGNLSAASSTMSCNFALIDAVSGNSVFSKNGNAVPATDTVTFNSSSIVAFRGWGP